MNTLALFRTGPLVNEIISCGRIHTYLLEKSIYNSRSLNSTLKMIRNFGILQHELLSSSVNIKYPGVNPPGKPEGSSGLKASCCECEPYSDSYAGPGDLFDMSNKRKKTYINREKNGCVKQR